MALFKIFKGSESELNKVPMHEGYAYFTTDKGNLFIDISNDAGDRVQVNALHAQSLLDATGNEIDVDDILLKDMVATVKQGGTGRNSLTANAILIGDGENPIKMVPIANGNIVVGDTANGLKGINGTGALYAATAGVPTFGVLPLTAGGVGANNAGDARTNLDVYSKAEVDTAVDQATSVATAVTLYSNAWDNATNGFTYTVNIKGLSCGKEHNVPPTVTYTSNLDEYSKIESAEATHAASKDANGTIVFSIKEKPASDIGIVIIDTK